MGHNTHGVYGGAGLSGAEQVYKTNRCRGVKRERNVSYTHRNTWGPLINSAQAAHRRTRCCGGSIKVEKKNTEMPTAKMIDQRNFVYISYIMKKKTEKGVVTKYS